MPAKPEKPVKPEMLWRPVHVTPKSEGAEPAPKVAYKTALGRAVLGKSEAVLESRKFAADLEGQVDLIFTSPPFPLNRKKKYGNEQGEAYVNWLADFAPLFKKVLKPKGSIVLELGNAWEAGRPVMSTLALKALLAFLGTRRVYTVPTVCLVQPGTTAEPGTMGERRTNSRKGCLYTPVVDVANGPSPRR